MNRKIRTAAVAAIAAASSLAIVGPANAETDTDITVAGNAQASFTGNTTWQTSFGSSSISGRLDGTLNWHGVFAGCARVRAQWMNAAGTVVDTDTSTVCSSSSLPASKLISLSAGPSTQLRRVRVQVQRKGAFDANFQNAGAAVTVVADGSGFD